MGAARVIMLIAVLLIAASRQSSPFASSNWNAKTSSRGMAIPIIPKCTKQSQCQAAQYCDGSRCIAKSSNGGACSNSVHCISKTCYEGKCFMKLNTGSKCDSSIQCRSDNCANQLCISSSLSITDKQANISDGSGRKDGNDK